MSSTHWIVVFFFTSYVSQSIKYDSDRIFIHFSCGSKYFIFSESSHCHLCISLARNFIIRKHFKHPFNKHTRHLWILFKWTLSEKSENRIRITVITRVSKWILRNSRVNNTFYSSLCFSFFCYRSRSLTCTLIHTYGIIIQNQWINFDLENE